MRSTFSKFLTAGLIAAFGVAGCGGGSGGDSTPTADGSAGVRAKVDASTFALPTDAAADKSALDAQGRRLYTVVLKGDPAVAYKGGVAGYAKTKADKGQRFDAKSSAVRAFRDHLKSRQTSILESVGGGKAVYHYTVAVNGFAARLTPSQARALRGQSQVMTVVPNRMLKPTTNNSPDFIQLNRPGKGFWDGGNFGDGIVVGVVDTGVWPEHPSFADDGSFGPPPPQWNVPLNEPGSCDFGDTAWNPTDAPFTCNNKLLAARNYNAAFAGDLLPGTYDSARDDDGHGSHTASTAAGNSDVPASIGGQSIGNVSGIAPRARVAVYKACHNGNEGGCGSVDLAAAIDQAVADGVDVINYSIGSSGTFFGGADDIAFLFAKDAGVFVATSNGNSGPGAETTGTPAGLPWITAVGASQDNDVLNQGIGISRPTGIRGTYEGVEGTSPVQLSDLGVVSGDLITPADPDNFEGCDPIGTDMTGMIALISRGACSFALKSANAEAAGAVMMYVYNNRPGAITMGGLGSATIPSFMVQAETGATFLGELDRNRRVASRVDSNETINKRYTIASFSSRGPNGGMPGILKPDVSAPGVQIQAAVTPLPIDGLYPGGAPGDLFGTLSGTSMASPHVAGVGALLKERHPDWTPGQIKSALMTKARRNLSDTFGTDENNWHIMGAGQARGHRSKPPFTTDTDFFADLGAICGEPQQAGIVDPLFCDDIAAAGYPTDPVDYNISSVTNPSVVGSYTTTREFTSVASNPQTFTSNVRRAPGFNIQVNPSVFSVDPGETVAIDFTVTANSNAVPGVYSYGQVTISNGRNLTAKIPVTVASSPFNAPSEVDVFGAGADGSDGYDVQFGFDGDIETVGKGLFPANRADDNVLDDPGNDFDDALGTCDFDADFPWPCTGITWHAIDVPDGASLLRVSLFDDFTDGDDDLDLNVFDPDGFFAGGSGSGTSEEQVDVDDPEAGEWLAAVHGWQTDGPDANYTLFDWVVTSDDQGNLIVSGPTQAVSGTTAPVVFEWTGLVDDEKYLGQVDYSPTITLTAPLPSTVLNVSTE